MRIGIDVRYLSHGLVGGVHTYVAQIVPALARQAGDHVLYLYADEKHALELEPLPEDRVTVRRFPWRSPLSSVWHDVTLWRHMARDRVDVAHFPANYGFGPPGARTVITLHDAINLLPLGEIIRGHRKDARTVALMTYLHLITRTAVRRADLVLTVSRHAGRQIAERGQVESQRIVPILHGLPPGARPITDPAVGASLKSRYGLDDRYVLADALKNPAVLVRAWRRLPADIRASHRIVFFSRRKDPPPVVREAEADGLARLLVRPPREDLMALYSFADAFAFPSWIEGFGLPVLEAMACGAPVIASNRGSIPEVAGDAALVVDAEDASALADRIAQLLRSPRLATELRRRGFARAAEFSWDRTAQETLAAYGLPPASSGQTSVSDQPSQALSHG